MLKKVFIILFVYSIGSAYAASLKPFQSDGCSVFPDGTLEQNNLWLKCCVIHDFAYWKGGTLDDRKRADQNLKNCVARLGKPRVAQLMLMGVRVGGSPYFPTKFRWGYGWPYFRGYQALNVEEKRNVEKSKNLDFVLDHQ